MSDKLPDDVEQFLDKNSFGIAPDGCVIGNCKSKTARRYYAEYEEATIEYVVRNHAYIDLCIFHYEVIINRELNHSGNSAGRHIRWGILDPGLTE